MRHGVAADGPLAPPSRLGLTTLRLAVGPSWLHPHTACYLLYRLGFVNLEGNAINCTSAPTHARPGFQLSIFYFIIIDEL